MASASSRDAAVRTTTRPCWCSACSPWSTTCTTNQAAAAAVTTSNSAPHHSGSRVVAEASDAERVGSAMGPV